ncbi:MAG TPA: helix-turn-helix transcriptional regulator [Candidatus Limnocylindria bacterium]|nr:helix-turn-helix transcriptional regulator [Candidatus Limnocylindria bacterium]
MERWSGDRLVAEVERVGARGLPYGELHAELAARIRRALPVDAFCWHGLDPDTRLLTTANPVELMTGGFLTAETEAMAAGAVVTSEYLREDVNTFAALAARRSPVGVLSETTRGRPERSARYVEYLQPIGTPYEMRAAMVTRGRAWGCVVLHRTQKTGDFTSEEARLLARLSRPVAEAMRSSYRVDAARRADEDRAPGLIVLGEHDDIELSTPQADGLLALLVVEDPARRKVPAAALSIAADVRSRGRVGRSASPLHVPTSSGWLTLYGSLPNGPSDGRVAIVVQRADADYSVPLRLEAFGLTPREREVATLVARGLDTAAIAARLVISPWTVQDHLKAVFAKTDTRSRRELLSQVFFHDQLPGIVAHDPVNAGGHLREPHDDSSTSIDSPVR